MLADFPNIADWSDGVITSSGTSKNADGVVATRAGGVRPGTATERITKWNPESEIVVLFHDTKKLPIKESLTTRGSMMRSCVPDSPTVSPHGSWGPAHHY